MAAKRKRRRRCKGMTKRGTRCQVAPLRGSKFCRAHDPQLPAESRFGSPEQAAAAASGVERRIPRVTELRRQRVEQEAEAILEPYFRAIKGAVVHAVYQGEVTVSEIPDLGARIDAAEKLLDRVEGKPHQVQELTGQEGGPIRVSEEAFADPKTREALNELVRRVGAARTGRPRRARTGD